MPTYLVRGFRWMRQAIRIHVIVKNIDDAAPDWVVAPDTTAALLEDFRASWPELMDRIPTLQFVEPYDLNDSTTHCAPYAFVGDIVREVKLDFALGDSSLAINEEDADYKSLVELRDRISTACMGIGADEKISWFVVVCGDEERAFTDSEYEGSEADSDKTSTPASVHTARAGQSSETTTQQQSRLSRGFRKLFGKKRIVSEAGTSKETLPVEQAASRSPEASRSGTMR